MHLWTAFQSCVLWGHHIIWWWWWYHIIISPQSRKDPVFKYVFCTVEQKFSSPLGNSHLNCTFHKYLHVCLLLFQLIALFYWFIAANGPHNKWWVNEAKEMIVDRRTHCSRLAKTSHQRDEIPRELLTLCTPATPHWAVGTPTPILSWHSPP